MGGVVIDVATRHLLMQRVVRALFRQRKGLGQKKKTCLASCFLKIGRRRPFFSFEMAAQNGRSVHFP